MRKDCEFLAVGDVVTDAFIRLKDPAAHIDIDRGNKEICMRFADKIPYEDVFIVPAVGNSSNAAVAASRLGLKSALVSNIGDDHFGQECLDALEKEKVSTKLVKINKGCKTNYHYVLWYEDDRTILVKHEEYDYKFPNIGEPKWVYLSSLGENSIRYHEDIVEYLVKKPQIKVAFQPGTFQIKFGKERLSKIYKRSDIFFCNKEEAQRILDTDTPDIKNLLIMVFSLGPKLVVITDGIKGAYTYDGRAARFMRPYPDPKPPLERTGAGDAFSSTFTAAIALGLDLATAMRWAPINSMSVVQQVGARAGLLTRREIEKYLAEAPEDYEPETM